LAILGGSFRLLARAVLPLAVLSILAGCGAASKGHALETTIEVRGNGFRFEVPRGWSLARPPRAVVARHAGELVSVTRFPLLKAYDPDEFAAVRRELDRVAARLDPKARGETVDVAGRKVRAYRYDDKRIAFVLEGKREYQLFCAHAGGACDLLFSSFALSGPSAA
jgi:predicted Zn-dependent protease